MGKLFGTDGVRGLANIELTPDLAFDLGRAGAYVLTKASNNKKKTTVVIGTDTRISANMLDAAMTAGFTSVGVNVVSAGVIPTPGLAYLVQKYDLDAGVMITASHNPFQDNGIKFISKDGYKLSDELEIEIEELILNSKLDSFAKVSGGEIGICSIADRALEDYTEYLVNYLEKPDLSGIKIALDCANGASSKVAQMLFTRLNADCLFTHNNPNGVNINDKCGSTHPESLMDFVKKNVCGIGFAFDGDADRCFAVDEKGELVDGEHILSIWGNYLKQNNKLRNNTLVTTVMANLGFSEMAKEFDLKIETTDVGDRYVLERMLEKDYVIGGEQSGHIIYRDYSTTGDGLLTAIALLEIVLKSGKPLSELKNVMVKFPQVLVGAKIANDRKKMYSSNEEITNAISVLNDKYKGDGRVFVRASGTEPLVRVMIEGKNLEEITNDANDLARLIERVLC